MMYGAGLTPEELEEQRRKEEVERLQKAAEEKAEAERREAEEAGLRRSQQEEWVGTTCSLWVTLFPGPLSPSPTLLFLSTQKTSRFV